MTEHTNAEQPTPSDPPEQGGWSPVRPVQRDGAQPPAKEVGWSPVRPVQRDGRAVTPPPSRTEAWSERDLFAEAQVRGLALGFYAIALLQALATVALGVASSKAPAQLGAGPPTTAREQLTLLAPLVLLAGASAARVLERRSFALLPVVVFGTFGGFWGWVGASIPTRLALAMGACAALSALVAGGLWRYGPIARLVTAAWALLGLVPVYQSLEFGSALTTVYCALFPLIVGLTLFLPRTGKVFDDRYSYLAARDPRSVNPLKGIPFWALLLWLGLPLLILFAIFAKAF